MLRKFLVGALCTLAVVACSKTIDGVLKNTEALTFNLKKGTTTLPVGQWEAALKFPNKKEVKLEVTIPNQKKALEVSFKVPKGSPLPQENGSFELSSQLSGQPYDAAGSVNTTHVDSEEKWGWENCTYQAQREECYISGNQHVCRLVYYTVHGRQDVRYFDRHTTQVVHFNLMSPGNKVKNAGGFEGVEQYSNRVITHQGFCR